MGVHSAGEVWYLRLPCCDCVRQRRWRRSWKRRRSCRTCTASRWLTSKTNLLAYVKRETSAKNSSKWVLFVTHRRSTAEWGGCFQRRLLVCLSVCLFVSMITSKRLNVGWWNLAVRCFVQKSYPSLNLEVICSTYGYPHPKMWRFAESVRKKKSTNGCGRGRHAREPCHCIHQ